MEMSIPCEDILAHFSNLRVSHFHKKDKTSYVYGIGEHKVFYTRNYIRLGSHVDHYLLKNEVRDDMVHHPNVIALNSLNFKTAYLVIDGENDVSQAVMVFYCLGNHCEYKFNLELERVHEYLVKPYPIILLISYKPFPVTQRKQNRLKNRPTLKIVS